MADMSELFTKISEYGIQYGLNLLFAILIFIVGKWAAKFLSGIVEQVMEKTHIEKTLASFVKNLSYVAMMVFVVIAALSQIGIQTTSFIAVLGAAGLAVGLALQGSLSNFAAGVLIIIFKPFRVGDAVQAGGVTGTVEEIHIFTTMMSGPDNRREIVPNAKITSDTITNFSAVGKRRVDMVFGISYNDDIKKAKDVLENLVKADPRVLKDNAVTIAVSELAESSVNLVCRPWVKPEHYWPVYFDILEKGKIELEKAGISIPFPQQDVRLFQMK